MKSVVLGVVAALCVCAIAQGEPAQVKLEVLEAEAEVHFDTYDIPHIFAGSWTDAYTTLGYLHARERLLQMDLFRRRASGTLAEIKGKGALKNDILMRQLGIRSGCEAYLASDACPDPVHANLAAYCAGVNVRINELRAAGKLRFPAPFDYEPAPWTPVDCVVFFKYMAWDQSGNWDDLWFGTVLETLGPDITNQLWPLERPYEHPAATVQAGRARPMAAAAPAGSNAAFQSAMAAFPKTRWLGETTAFGSNNWAVSGDKTVSGKPILCSDPHLGFRLPSLWYAWHISVDGANIIGVGFPGCPYMIIGHNDFLGWGITNLQADAVDFFVETVDPDDPLRYRHRGEWKQMTRVTEEIPVRGEDPHTLHIDSTVHGPVVNRDEEAIAMQWIGLGATGELTALWKMNRARNLEQWLEGIAHIEAVGLSLAYADVHGNIALAATGRYPIRLRGQGRVPMDGASGGHDWTRRIPADEMPLSINPPEGFVASANGRPAPAGYPHYIGWMWDPSYRKRRIDEMLSGAEGFTVDKMKAAQYDHKDLAAERFIPYWLADLADAPIEDPFARNLLDTLRQWDYVADAGAVQPRIWLTWLNKYRAAVWSDEWDHFGLDQPGGSWGFTGINQREPVFEVLEYITREQPDSIWFDDRSTPERETRADIVLRTFKDTAAALREKYGEDLDEYAWGKTNVLSIRSMFGSRELGRKAGPTPGTMFTPNPGGGIGSVGGGASWRMIVDFGAVDRSAGVYPGGQSGDPASPHYDDLMGLWAKGEYVELHMVLAPEALPEDARRVVFSP